MNKNKNYLLIGIIVLIVIFIGTSFTIAYKNYKTNKTSTTGATASDVSKDYDSINYGSSKTLEETTITTGGSYDLTGTYSSITINTSDNVELNLNGVTITATDGPAINVVKAKTVSIVLNGENKITSTTTEDLDGAIYSKADLVFSGTGSLTIESNYDGIVSKDTLVIKSGTYNITSSDDGIRGKDNVAIVDGTFNITATGDGIKSTNDEDTSLGYITIDNGTFNLNCVNDGIQAETSSVINDGTFNITTTGNANNDSAKGLKAGTLIELNGGTYNINTTDDGIHSNGNITINNGTYTIESKDDAIHADGMIVIGGGTFDITAAEGIEATYVKINDGVVNISASDDGINAGNKSSAYSVTIEINGGYITIKMGQGDTDGIDSNGALYINGGTVDITAQTPFDYDGEAKYTGGTIIVNGETTNAITNQMMGGGMMNGGTMPGGDPNQNGQNQNGRRMR